jgi:hypothetical protein
MTPTEKEQSQKWMLEARERRKVEPLMTTNP